jgi:hypothetical protein
MPNLVTLIQVPIVPLYGGFPVRLRTHVGKPIYPADYDGVEAVRQATVEAMEALIRRHQKLPGSVARSVRERFDSAAYPLAKHYEFVVSKVVSSFDKFVRS